MQMRRPANPSRETFEQFEATVLFCNRCRAPQPVRERLLLVLPDGELNEYLCRGCGASVGSRKVTNPNPIVIAS
jgi:ribosomal protein L40E